MQWNYEWIFRVVHMFWNVEWSFVHWDIWMNCGVGGTVYMFVCWRVRLVFAGVTDEQSVALVAGEDKTPMGSFTQCLSFSLDRRPMKVWRTATNEPRTVGLHCLRYRGKDELAAICPDAAETVKENSTHSTLWIKGKQLCYCLVSGKFQSVIHIDPHFPSRSSGEDASDPI